MALEGKNSENNGKTSWRKNKNIFSAIAAVIGLIIALVVLGVFFFSPKPTMADLVSFTCSVSSDAQTFTIKAKVNLTDGMDKGEAEEVANKVLLEISKQSEQRDLQSISVDSNQDDRGIWTVEFAFVYSSPFGSYHDSNGTSYGRKIFSFTINPFDQTVHCK